MQTPPHPTPPRRARRPLPGAGAGALAALALACGYAAPVQAADAAPYKVSVRASVLFAPDGTAAEVRVIDEATHPQAFVDNVKARLQKARIPPQQADGQPATFRTGVLLDYLVTPEASGGKVTLTSLKMAPLPTKQFFASYPTDIAQAGGWRGAVQASCVVGVEGRCTAITVRALPGMPDSVRRYARVSLEGWLFQPQELNGKPVEGEYEVLMEFETPDTKPDDPRTDKFQRVQQGR